MWPSRRCAAIHESGHAVAAFVLGAQLRAVTARTGETEREAGYCRYALGVWQVAGEARRGRLTRQYWRAIAAINLAGPCAELRALGRVDRGTMADDLARASDAVRRFTTRAEKTMVKAALRSEQILAAHWRALEALAAVLEQRPVTGAEASAILAAAGCHPDPNAAPGWGLLTADELRKAKAAVAAQRSA